MFAVQKKPPDFYLSQSNFSDEVSCGRTVMNTSASVVSLVPHSRTSIDLPLAVSNRYSSVL